MRILLKSVRVVDPGSTHNGKTRDILIKSGRIDSIAPSIRDDKAKTVSIPRLHASPGWIDLRAQFFDPGEEFREGIPQGLDVAARGGFTRVVVLPSPTAAATSASDISYVLRKAGDHIVKALPAGALSYKGKGANLSEIYDMMREGAVIFTDDKRPVEKVELMHRALDYSRSFDVLIGSVPFDGGFAPGGQMHEGLVSTSLGMKGIPELSETLRLQRDCTLLEYTGATMHVSLLSTSGGVDIVRKAKKSGLRISADICAHQLCFTDQDLAGFDTRFKMMPPLRGENHGKALVRGLKEGTIDAICSDHTPLDTEAKHLEFAHAAWGGSTLEAAFSGALMALNQHMELPAIIEKFTYGPAKVLKQDIYPLEEGNPAELSLFDPEVSWKFVRETVQSRSMWSPWEGKTLRGRALGIIRGEQSRFF